MLLRGVLLRLLHKNYFEPHSSNILIYYILGFIFRCGMSKWDIGSFQKGHPLTVRGHKELEKE